MSLVGAIGAGPIGAGPLLLAGQTSSGLSGAATVTTAATGTLAARLQSAAAVAATATGTLINWATVTLTSPLYTGPGGLLDPEIAWPFGPPIAGDVIFYDPSFITILPDSEFVSTSNNCIAVVQFSDGIRMNRATVTITPLIVGYANVGVVLAGQLGSDFSANLNDVTGATGNISIGAGFSSPAVVASAAHAALTNYASVTLAAPLFTGVGSILEPNASWTNGAPGIGSVVFYDPTFITIQTNGEIVSTVPACVALALWNNGGVWSELNILVTQGMVSYATVTTLAAATLSSAIQLLGAANEAVTATGALGARAQLQGNAPVGVTAGGALTTGVTLQSALTSLTSSSAALTAQITLLASAATATSASGAIITATGFVSAATTLSAAVGALVTGVRMAANAASATSATGLLNTGALMVANASSGTAAAGQIDTQILLASVLADVTTATGDLTTQIALQSNVIDLTAAAAGLSTSQSIAGMATVTSTVVGELVTGLAAFGYATLTALSQMGAQGARSVYIEGSSCVIAAAFYGAAGLPYSAARLQYRVDDIVSGTNLVPWTSVTPNPQVQVTITAAENAMVSFSRPFETHQILFQITDGAGNSFYARTVFEIVRAVGAVN